MKSKVEQLSTKAMIQTVTKMVPAILTALLAAALGFLALYTSPVPMIQDFGKMLTIGMAVSFIIGLVFAVPILYVRDKFFFVAKEDNTKKTAKASSFEKLLEIFTRKVVSYKWIIILLSFILAASGIYADLKTGVETDIENFMPQDTKELKDIHKLRDIMGTTDQVSILYSAQDMTDQQYLDWIDNTTRDLSEKFPQAIVQSKSITSVVRQLNENQEPTKESALELIEDMPKEQLKLLINEDNTKGVITLGIKKLEAGELKSFIEDLETYLEKNKISGLSLTVTGKSVLDVEMVSALTTGRYKMTLLGMAAVFLGLLLIYRNPIKALIPLIPIILIVGWSGGIMYLFDIRYTPLTATLGALIIGIGTEFTILIMERFYEERKKGNISIDSIVIANTKIGKAIFASAFTTIGGFSALLISDFIILRNFGMMTLINIFFALISTVVVMPAVLVLMDKTENTKETV